MGRWILLALWTSANSTADPPTTLDHVRSAEMGIRMLIDDGYERSATFRQLVDQVERRSCVVYVASSVKLSQGMRGALLHWPAGSRETPVLRVLVKTNLGRDEEISVIGHELQHVIEAVDGLSANRDASITAAFERLDPAAAASDARAYETNAAVVVMAAIRRELHRNPRNRRTRQP